MFYIYILDFGMYTGGPQTIPTINIINFSRKTITDVAGELF